MGPRCENDDGLMMASCFSFLAFFYMGIVVGNGFQRSNFFFI